MLRQSVPLPGHNVDRLLAGRYALEEPLGSGGAAIVYRARDTLLGVPRAIKILQAPTKGRKSFRRRLHNEAKVMARLKNPHLLQVYDIGNENDRDYIVMALAEGGSLGDALLRNGPLSAATAVDFTLQLLYGLDVAHRAGIVHRDIKPGNLLLDGAGSVMLADFGIALIQDDEFHRKTVHGAMMGSMAFMAPEQRLDARSVGVAADIYSVGSTLYALITAGSSIDLFTASPESPRWAGLPPTLAAVIRKAVHQKPGQRFASARQMAVALAQIASALPRSQDHLQASPVTTQAAVQSLLADTPTVDDFDTLIENPLPEPAHHSATPFEGYQPTSSDEGVSTIVHEHPWTQTHHHSTEVHDTTQNTDRFDGLLLVLGALMLGSGAVWWSQLPPREVVLPALPSSEVAVAAAPDGDLLRDPPPIVESVPPALALPEEPVAPNPGPEPESAPERPPAPSPAPAPAVQNGPLSGVWRGVINGRSAQFTIQQRGARIEGEVIVRFGQNTARHKIKGRYDQQAGSLTFEDLDQSNDAGVYEATLSEDKRSLSGRFETRSGRSVKFSLSRS